MSSNSDFITSFLNVKSDDIEEYDIKHINDNVFVDIKLNLTIYNRVVDHHL